MQDLWLPAKSLASNSGNCQGVSHSLYQAFLLCGHSHPTSLSSVPGPAAISSLHWALKSLGLASFSSSQQASTTPQRGRVPSALQWGKNASFPWLDVLCEKIGPPSLVRSQTCIQEPRDGLEKRPSHCIRMSISSPARGKACPQVELIGPRFSFYLDKYCPWKVLSPTINGLLWPPHLLPRLALIYLSLAEDTGGVAFLEVPQVSFWSPIIYPHHRSRHLWDTLKFSPGSLPHT